MKNCVNMLVALIVTAVLQLPATAQSESVLHRFSDGRDGAVSMAGLISDAEGNLYGTTMYGGEHCDANFFLGCGTVFELSPQANGKWRLRTLHTFLGGTDGANPYAGLVFDSAGNLYGTTLTGGNPDLGAMGYGTVFELQHIGNNWQETVLHSFHIRDGAYPMAPLTWGPDGALYGTTSAGGHRHCTAYHLNLFGCGMVFRLKQYPSGWWEERVHVFNGMDGAQPYGGVTFDQAGNLYGTTSEGGTLGLIQGGGTVYQLTKVGKRKKRWVETTLYTFPTYEGQPRGELVIDSSGNVYGAAEFGGVYGSGSVFETSQSGTAWTLNTLHSFTGAYGDGWFPTAGVVLDSDGNLYGTTSGGPAGNCHVGCGQVFMLDKSNSWAETVLHDFEGPDGALPWASLLLKGNHIYGTTYVGGISKVCLSPTYPGCGTVFEISH